MPQALYILFGAVFTVAVCAALGELLIGRLALKFERGERALFAFVLGAPMLSLAVFALASLGLARKGVFLVLGGAVIGVLWFVKPRPSIRAESQRSFAGCNRSLTVAARFRVHVKRSFRAATARERFFRPPTIEDSAVAQGPSFRLLFWGVFALFAVLYFFNAMAPEMSPDGSAYHLGLISRYLREHGFVRITTNMYANLSQGLEMLFLFAFAFGRHSAAALVHFAFLAALALLMRAYGRRAGFPSAGAAAALFVFASPVVGIDGTSAYVDVGVACVLFALFYLLEIWHQERSPALLVAIGLLAGFAYAVKYTAGIAVPYAAAYVAWKLWRARKPVLRPMLAMGVLAAVSILPWMVKNTVLLGNPVSPFFNAAFPNPYVRIEFEKEYSEQMRNYQGLQSRWDIPWEVTVRGQVLCGLLGPLFLLAPLGIGAARFGAGRRLLLAAAVFGAPYFLNIGTRFLIPALPFLALAMALALSSWPYVLAGLALAHALLCWPDVLKLYCAQYAWRLDKVPVRQALRLEKEESYLGRKMPSYHVARLIEDSTPPGSTVLTFTPVPEAYTTREVRVVYQSAANSTLGAMIFAPLVPDVQPVWHLRFRFPLKRLAALRAVQTASGGPDQWSVSELRVYREGKEVPRQPFWRLRARPNPWDVQMAFDNSPITRWQTGEYLEPGMFIEVNFARAFEADEVVLESTRDQYKVRVRLEAQDTSGKWSILAPEPEVRNAAPPIGLRRAAVEELRAARIGYLLFYDGDFAAEDFRKNAAIWGVTLAGERHGARLYALK